MLTKGSVTIGLDTRFGPNWPGVRCGARTKAGGECQRPAVKRTGRCTRHGGKSTGPNTQAGRDKIAAHYLFYGSKKFYPIQILAVLIFNLTIFGTIILYIEEADKTEFLQLIFYIPASLILYNATRPEVRNIFRKR